MVDTCLSMECLAVVSSIIACVCRKTASQGLEGLVSRRDLVEGCSKPVYILGSDACHGDASIPCHVDAVLLCQQVHLHAHTACGDPWPGLHGLE